MTANLDQLMKQAQGMIAMYTTPNATLRGLYRRLLKLSKGSEV